MDNRVRPLRPSFADQSGLDSTMSAIYDFLGYFQTLSLLRGRHQWYIYAAFRIHVPFQAHRISPDASLTLEHG